MARVYDESLAPSAITMAQLPSAPPLAQPSDYHIITCFRSIDSPGVSDEFWNRMIARFTESDIIHVEVYFNIERETWRITNLTRGDFYKGKEFQNSGWKTIRTDLSPERYNALRSAFADYKDYRFDMRALKWYACFPSGCCTRTNSGYTMCSHVVADVFSREDVHIIEERDSVMPFTSVTPARLYAIMFDLSTSRHGHVPAPVAARSMAAMSEGSLMRAMAGGGG